MSTNAGTLVENQTFCHLAPQKFRCATSPLGYLYCSFLCLDLLAKSRRPIALSWMSSSHFGLGLYQRVLVRAKRGIQCHFSRQISICETVPRLNRASESLKAHKNLTRSPCPIPVPPVPRMPAEAEVQSIASQLHPTQLLVPLEAPVIAVLVPTETSRQVFGVQ